MFIKNKMVEVFEDTIDWIESDEELSASVNDSIGKTEVYFEDDYPVFEKSADKVIEISVTRDKSFQAAMRLSKENPGKKIAVMNFANAFTSGGGVAGGARAQEESLCRTSTLYPVIARPEMWNSYYAHHRKLNNPRATDSLIYSEDIIICKTDDDIPVRMPKEDWVKTDIITVAAPHLSGDKGWGLTISDAELLDIHIKRAFHVLTVAASKNVDILVLGAFGCGAFNNNPYVVAKAYKVVLQQFENQFERVEFAIYCRDYETENYEAFFKTFNN